MDESQSVKLSYIDSTKVAPDDKTHHALMALGQVLMEIASGMREVEEASGDERYRGRSKQRDHV